MLAALFILVSLLVLFSCIVILSRPWTNAAPPHYAVHGRILTVLAHILFLVHVFNALLQLVLPSYSCLLALWMQAMAFPMWMTLVSAYAWQSVLLYWGPIETRDVVMDMLEVHTPPETSGFQEVSVSMSKMQPMGLWVVLYMLGGVGLAQIASTIVVSMYSTNYLWQSSVVGDQPQCQGQWEMLPTYAIACLLLVSFAPAVAYMIFHLRKPMYVNFAAAFLALLSLVPIVLVLDVSRVADPVIVQVLPLSLWFALLSFLAHFMVYILPVGIDVVRLARSGRLGQNTPNSLAAEVDDVSSSSHKSSEEKSDLSMHFYGMLNDPEERDAFEAWLTSQTNKVFRVHYAFYMACYSVRRTYIRRRSLGGQVAAVYDELNRIYHTYIIPSDFATKVTAIHTATRDELIQRFSSGRVPTDVFTAAEYEVRDYIMQGAFTQWNAQRQQDTKELGERRRRQSMPSTSRRHASVVSVNSDNGIVLSHPSQSFSRLSVDERMLQSKPNDTLASRQVASADDLMEALRLWQSPRLPRPGSVTSDARSQASTHNLGTMPEG
jgi:hypothetical protein